MKYRQLMRVYCQQHSEKARDGEVTPLTLLEELALKHFTEWCDMQEVRLEAIKELAAKDPSAETIEGKLLLDLAAEQEKFEKEMYLRGL